MIEPNVCLYCCLQAVTGASGSDGIDPQVLKWTRAYRKAFKAHEVTANLAMFSIGVDLTRYFGPNFDLDDATKRDLRDFAVAEAKRQGFAKAKLDIEPTLATTLGTMAITMAQQNEGTK